ncbi:MAG: hypothetical protein HZC43_02225 [Nitrosomonadales bacterium]|nr:hypothetical protein [Nitrosomonadales bacterium]
MNAPSDLGQFSQVVNMPLISRRRFAELIGMSEGVVQAWIARGYLPVYEIGKYRLINLALLNHMAMQKAPKI